MKKNTLSLYKKHIMFRLRANAVKVPLIGAFTPDPVAFPHEPQTAPLYNPYPARPEAAPTEPEQGVVASGSAVRNTEYEFIPMNSMPPPNFPAQQIINLSISQGLMLSFLIGLLAGILLSRKQ